MPILEWKPSYSSKDVPKFSVKYEENGRVKSMNIYAQSKKKAETEFVKSTCIAAKLISINKI